MHPSALREVLVRVPETRWADIGGQAQTKQQLKEAVRVDMLVLLCRSFYTCIVRRCDVT